MLATATVDYYSLESYGPRNTGYTYILGPETGQGHPLIYLELLYPI